MTNLTDRMRTCAAHLRGAEKVGDGGLRDFGRAIIDAADLLIEAADLLDGLVVPLPPSEPTPPIVTQNAPPLVNELEVGQWVTSGDTLVSNPYRGRHTCPQCDSRAAKRVYRQGNSLVLECPVCGHAWKRA